MADSANSPWGNYLVISREPLIVVASGPYETIEHLAPALADQRVCFLAVFWWHQSLNDRERLLRFLHRHRSARHEIIGLCNERELVEALRSHGFESEFCHHNAFLDERLFVVEPNAPKRFDAVYNANFDAFKRHELAAELDDLAIITYATHTAGLDRVESMRRVCPHWHWLNFDAAGTYSRLTPAQVCRHLNESRVGLCLSSYEGGMFASAEYLLCGLPVVSTRSVGGRTEFFHDDFVKIVDDTPRAVRDGVAEMIERSAPPGEIRRRTLDRMAEHRARFIDLVQSIYDREGVRRSFADEWDQVFTNKMYLTQPCDRAACESGPAGRASRAGLPHHRSLRVRMDISARCNLQCTMCHFAVPGFTMGAGDMSKELIDRIADEILPLTSELYLSCSTEPMTAEHFPYLLELASERRVPFTEFTTNGTLLTETAVAQILHANVASVVVSIDGATRATFENIRRGASFDGLLANLAGLQEAKRRAGTALPHLKLTWVLMRSNIDELPEYVDLAHSLGVDTIGCVHLIANARLHIEHELLNREKALTNRYLDLARARAARLGITFFGPSNFAVGSEPSSALTDTVRPELRPRDCPCPTSEVVILPDGRVLPCGYWWGRFFGDLTRQSFADIWRGEQYRELRASFGHGTLMKPCEVCPSAGRGHVDNPDAFAVFG